MATFAVSSRTKTKEKYGTKKGCANPLFEQWLIEWRDEAKEKGHPNHYGYDKVCSVNKKISKLIDLKRLLSFTFVLI